MPFTLFTLRADDGVVGDIALSPDGERLAVSNTDGTTALWLLPDSSAQAIPFREEQVPVTLAGHTGGVGNVAFNPDGARLTTASFYRTAKVWDVEASVASGSGVELLTLSGHTGPALDVAFSPDGKRLATASSDGTVRVHVLPLEELVALARSCLTRSLMDAECQQYLHLEVCPDEP